MNYIKINDETEYIYWMLQKLFRPSPITGFVRDEGKEKELYSSKDIFRKNLPASAAWKIVAQIPMYASRSGIRYQLYCFSKNNKTAFVAAQYHDQETLSFELPQTPVFCYQDWLDRAHYVVFSDNPLIAASIQNQLQHEPLWIATSFLQKQDLKDLDFSVFAKKTVVYYLVEHSANDWKNTCLNASDIINRFPEDTEVYIISYPENDVSILRSGHPVFLSNRQQFEEEVRQLEKQSVNLQSVNWNTPQPIKRKQIVEGMLEKTLTWIYDSSTAFRTQYLTQWAVAISQGKTNLQYHQIHPVRKTAYLYVNEFDDGFITGIQMGMESVWETELPSPPLPLKPASVSDAWLILNQPDLFLSYPPKPEDPFHKVQQNFFYTSFWPNATLENNKTSVAIQLLIKFMDNLEQYHPDVEIVVCDIPQLWMMGIPFANLMQFLYYVRSRYSVILATNIPMVKQRDLIRNLPFDKIIRLQRKSDTPEATNIDLIFERDDIENKIHTVRLMRNRQDKFWKHRAVRKLSVKEKIQYIKQHKDMELKKVAIALGISESYVKKLRGLAGVSKKVPSRAPKYPKRKPVEYSV